MAKGNNNDGSNVKVYTASSLTYLGVRTGNAITGMQIASGTITQDAFADYLKAEQMKELVIVEVGANSDVITRELSRREVLDFKLVQMEFSEAKDTAEDWLVNRVFDELRGK